MVGDHYEVKVDGEWMPVPKDKINNVVAPDGGATSALRDRKAATRAFYSASSSRQRAEIFREVIRADSEVMPMKLPRRQFLHLAGGAAAVPAVSRIARAQAYPTRPVRIVLGFGAGGAPDIVARLMGQWLSERLGQQFIIENRPGASGNIATEAVARAPSDGHTLLILAISNAVNATLYDKLNFDFLTDIAPVAGISRETLALEVHPSFPGKTMPEFVSYAKANPNNINYASAGTGTSQRLSMENAVCCVSSACP
jgi:Tripartite tricarboxylate transporter family receptor